VRMKHDRDRRILLASRMVSPLNASGGASENHFGHSSTSIGVGRARKRAI